MFVVSPDPERDVVGVVVPRGLAAVPAAARQRRAGAGRAPAGRRALRARAAALRLRPRRLLHAHRGRLGLLHARREPDSKLVTLSIKFVQSSHN